MTPTPEMIEAAILGAWEHTVQFNSGVSWAEWRENNPDAAGEFSKGIEVGLKAALAAMWRPISEAPFSSNEGLPTYLLLKGDHHIGTGYRRIPNYEDDPEFCDESGQFIEERLTYFISLSIFEGLWK